MVADIVILLSAGSFLKSALKQKAPKVSQTIGNTMYCLAKAKICSKYGAPPSDVFLHCNTMKACMYTSSQAGKKAESFVKKIFKKKS